jgi:hypothetical protein
MRITRILLLSIVAATALVAEVGRAQCTPTLLEQLIPSDGQPGDFYGYSVAVEEPLMAVLCHSTPAVYVYELVGGDWLEDARLTPSVPAALDSLDLRGDTLVVGGRSAGRGVVFVFRRTSGTWTELAVIEPTEPSNVFWFGASVAYDAGTLVVGDPGWDDPDLIENGRVYVYEEGAGGFALVEVLELYASGLLLGQAVDIEGDRLVAGAPGAILTGVPSRGIVFVYSRAADGTWFGEVDAYVLPPADAVPSTDPYAYSVFGAALELEGDRIAVGAEQMDTVEPDGTLTDYEGAAFVYDLDPATGQWNASAVLRYPRELYPTQTSFDSMGFGRALDLRDGRLAVRAYGPLIHDLRQPVFLYELASDGSWQLWWHEDYYLGSSGKGDVALGPDQLLVGLALGNVEDVGSVLRYDLSCAPVADAGADQAVDEGTLAALDGSGSTGTGQLSFAWTQLAGTEVVLAGADTATPTFIAPVVGFGGETLSFQLVVTAGGVPSAPDLTNVTVQNVNAAPVADAGPLQTVGELTPVTLDGTGSFDPNDDPLTYAWAQIAGPEVTLDGADTATPGFLAPNVPPEGAQLAFLLTVSDSELYSSSETQVEVTNVNVPPVADAGSDQTVDEGTLVTLDGAQSSDGDEDVLSYYWTQLSGPSVALDTSDPVHPTFVAPLVGPEGAVLEFELVVDDGLATSAPDTVAVVVLGLNAPPSCVGAQGEMLWPPNHKLVAVDVLGLVDPDGTTELTVTYDAVMQDEPTLGTGNGDTSPDAVLVGGQLYLRAEREKFGDGRVYHVFFTATDAYGDSCSGEVTFTVPAKKKLPVVDGGALFDSFTE